MVQWVHSSGKRKCFQIQDYLSVIPYHIFQRSPTLYRKVAQVHWQSYLIIHTEMLFSSFCRHLGIIYIFTFVTFYFLNNLAHKKYRNELIILSYLEVLFDTTNMRSVTFWPRKFGFFCYSVQVHVPTLYLDMPNKVNYIPFLKCF